MEVSKLLLWYGKYFTNSIYQVVVKADGVEVSKLLLWYGKDFGSSDKEVLQWIQQGKNFKCLIFIWAGNFECDIINPDPLINLEINYREEQAPFNLEIKKKRRSSIDPPF